jgi:predicted transcriptional regulator
MSSGERFYDLLFEMSNEHRHNIMLLLREEAMRLTSISKELDLTSPEISRHVSRLSETGLVTKDVEGFFSLTPLGGMVLTLLQEFEFASRYTEYFASHIHDGLPSEYVKRIGELSGSKYIDSIPGFFRQIERVITEAEEYVWLLVDQFPLNHLSLIVEAIERGVKFRVVEPRNRVFTTVLDAMAPEESRALTRTKITPLVEQRMLDEVNVYLYVSDGGCVTAFPTLKGENEYKGFTSSDDASHRWCRELFLHHWDRAEERIPSPAVEVKRGQLVKDAVSTSRTVVVGRERPDLDAQAIQDAVDNYDEVILKGRFNIGTSTIYLNKSVTLRGEGRTNDIPDTKILKTGWDFPFLSQEYMFLVRGDDIDVTIENLHVEDFNGTCINTRQGNSLTLRGNRITLLSGLGRGLSFGAWGDHVVGMTLGGYDVSGGFPGGILVEENYLDFALSYARGGFITNKGLENEPDYRPDLQNHEAAICVGIIVARNLGKVVVRNNVIRNMNARGIVVFDNWETADIEIVNNTIVSEVFGVYPYNNPMSGVGILVQSAWTEPRSGSRVEVAKNKITCDKVNYCGIAVHGPSMYQEGAGKLEVCIIRDNEIKLKEGSFGIQVRRSDFTEVFNNKISGKAYYGIQVSGSKDREGIDLGANANRFEGNDLEGLVIKEPDEYGDAHVDGRMFTGSGEKSATANVWLNNYTKGNMIKVKAYETVIDEGEDNKIEYGDQA